MLKALLLAHQGRKLHGSRVNGYKNHHDGYGYMDALAELNAANEPLAANDATFSTLGYGSFDVNHEADTV